MSQAPLLLEVVLAATRQKLGEALCKRARNDSLPGGLLQPDPLEILAFAEDISYKYTSVCHYALLVWCPQYWIRFVLACWQDFASVARCPPTEEDSQLAEDSQLV